MVKDVGKCRDSCGKDYPSAIVLAIGYSVLYSFNNAASAFLLPRQLKASSRKI